MHDCGKTWGLEPVRLCCPAEASDPDGNPKSACAGAPPPTRWLIRWPSAAHAEPVEPSGLGAAELCGSGRVYCRMDPLKLCTPSPCRARSK